MRKRNKGSKRERWLKDGIRESRKVMKKYWNRRVRNSKKRFNHASYRKLAKDSAYCMVQ